MEKEKDLPYAEAGLGLVSTSDGFRRADGTKADGRPRGCPACNKDTGRRSSSLELRGDLLLAQSGDQDAEGIPVRVVIDYCPVCGRVYDLRLDG